MNGKKNNLHAIDLHVHSTASDGTLTPKEVVTLGYETGLSAMALTDHDTTSGIAAARNQAEALGLEFIPGVELSCDHEGKEIHMVGLYIRDTDSTLNETLEKFRDNRENRNEKMAARLREEGFDVSLDILLKTFPDSVLTRAHFARYLVDTKQVKDLSTVFERYLGDGCKCYVAREKISPFDAVSLIRNAGGIPILAHPLLYHLEDAQLEKLVSDLKDCGLMGLEAIYSMNTGMDEANMKALAKRYDLLLSGGSDFHGANKPHIQIGKGRGSLFVPYEVLQEMKRFL